MDDLSRRDFLKLSGLGALSALLPLRVQSSAAQRYRAVEHIDPRFGVLMTIDDGYSRTFVPMIEVLYRYRVPIAFFAVGRALPLLTNHQGENLVEKLVEVGGIVCNHSYTHPYFTHLSEREIAEQLEGWENAMRNAMGSDYLRDMKARFPYFRIPFGAGKNLGRVLRVLDDYGYIVVWWNWDEVGTVLKFVDEAHFQDALKEPLFSTVVEAIAQDAALVHPGDIMLMHSNDWSEAALEGVLQAVAPLKWADPTESLAQAVSHSAKKVPQRRFPGVLPDPL